MMLKCNKTSKIIYCIIYCYRYTLIFSKSAFRLKNDGDNFPFNPSAAKENQKKKRTPLKRLSTDTAQGRVTLH